MGQVYEAVHVGVERKVAVKTLRQDTALNARSISRLRREAKIAGSIGHDHICEVIDTGADKDGLPYLVMPLLKGRTLKSLLDAEAPLDTARSIYIASRILEGLDAAHARHIVHRDLKPGNVFLTKVGNQDDFVKILDFGVSKRMDLFESRDLTKSGAVPGTPLYMSPEQAGGASHIDHRTDIYAVGVLLYEMLTGGRPFEGESYNEIITRIAGGTYSSPIALNKTIPKSLNRLVLKAMSRNPDDRFASAKQMLAALNTLKPSVSAKLASDDSSTQSGEIFPFGVLHRASFSKENRGLAKIAITCGLVFIAVTAYAIIHGRSQTQKSSAAKTASPSLRDTSPAEPDVSPATPDRNTHLSEKAASLEPTNSPVESVDTEASHQNENTNKEARSPTQTKRPVKPRRRKPSASKPATVFTGKKNTLFSEDYGR